MEQAKKLLQQTELPVYEISRHVGYADTVYFSRLSEKATGDSRGQNRQKRSIKQ